MRRSEQDETPLYFDEDESGEGKGISAGDEADGVGDTNRAQPPAKSEPRSRDQKTIIVLTGVVLALCVVIGIALILKSEAARQPVEAARARTAAEESSFATKYGGRYSDARSTYYAERALEASSGGKAFVMPDEFFKNYNMSAQQSRTSPIGFEWYGFPWGEVTPATAVDIFNNATAPELNLYMNALAKNPTTDAERIIDFEFTNWCSNTAVAFTEDDEYIANLMTTLKAVVAKYGSNANYSIAKGSTLEEDGGTFFDPINTIAKQGTNPDGSLKAFSSSADMVIDVVVYNGNQRTNEKLTIKNIQLLYTRQPGSGNKNLSIGQIGQVDPIQ